MRSLRSALVCKLRLLAASLLLALASGLPASAQGPVPGGPPNFPPDTSGALQQMQGASAWHTVWGVSNHVGDVLLGAPVPPAGPAPLPFRGEEQSPASAVNGAWLAFDEGEKTPGLPQAAAASTPQWSIWIDSSLTWSERDDIFVGNEGELFTASFGLDRRIGERGVVGVIANVEDADFDTTFTNGRLETSGGGLGVYGGYAITDRIVLDAVALWKSLESDFRDPFRTASFDTDRLQVAANITGYFYRGPVSIRPKIGIAHTRDDQESYFDTLGLFTPSRTVERTTFSAGGELGYTIWLDDTRSLEPYVGAAALVENFSTDPTPVPAPRDELDAFDLRLTAGLKARLAERFVATLKADVTGIARDDFREVTAGGQVSLQF